MSNSSCRSRRSRELAPRPRGATAPPRRCGRTPGRSPPGAPCAARFDATAHRSAATTTTSATAITIQTHVSIENPFRSRTARAAQRQEPGYPGGSFANRASRGRARRRPSRRRCRRSPSSPGRRRSRAAPACRRGTASTWPGFAARMRSTSGSSSATSDDGSWARYGSAEKPGSPACAIASSNAFRGIRSRASTSLPSSAGSTAAGSTPAPASWFMTTFATARRSPGVALVQRVAAVRHEPLGEGEVELGLEPPDPRAGELGQLGPHPLDQLRRRLDGDEVRLREVAVVLGLLLRAPRA